MKNTARTTPAPRNDGEARAAIARLGTLARAVSRIETNCDAAVGRLTEAAGRKAAPLRAQQRALTEGLQAYCEAHRARLTGDHATKTVDFVTGKVSWRNRPASVKLAAKADVILARLRALGLDRFIRVKDEVNKEAMLSEPAAARTVAGVTIASDGEDFVVVPRAGPSPARCARDLSPQAGRGGARGTISPLTSPQREEVGARSAPGEGAHP